ncbi:MAG: class I SAM-dependent methyltransferase [Planctomycetota bacterium]
MADAPDDDRRRGEWAALAAPWINEMRQGRNANRVGLLDDVVMSCCCELAGRRVIDSGCGEGRWCRIAANAGASEVLGLDLCDAMIQAAVAVKGPREAYRVADVRAIPFVNDATFDIAVSYLNQCDLDDFVANTREVFRVLKPGGRLVVANLHPMRSAVGTWHRDESGAKRHVVVDDYFDEGARTWRMLGVEFTNYHRSLQTYLDAYLEAGFHLRRIAEPTVSAENLEQYPELDDELRVPNFIVFALDEPYGPIQRTPCRGS